MTYFMCCSCVSLVVVFLFFFFFKQKTAYEMRISDWSSDVCSSDLCLARHRCRQDAVRRASRAIHRAPLPKKLGRSSTSRHVPTNPEIGRASCRERVCQYV